MTARPPELPPLTCDCNHAPCRHDAERFLAERDALAAEVERLSNPKRTFNAATRGYNAGRREALEDVERALLGERPIEVVRAMIARERALAAAKPEDKP